jgi:hypothetical protein
MEKTMPATKEQMNVQIPATLKDLAKVCAAAQQKSLNSWIEVAIQEQVARDRKTLNLDAMNKDLKKFAAKYLPGKVATKAQMLAMARRVAAEDTSEGFTVEHYKKPTAAPRRKTTGARPRGR